MKAEMPEGDLVMNASCCAAHPPVTAIAELSWKRRAEQALVIAFERLWVWHDRARSRRALLGMDDRMLQDIGVDRASAQHEGTRPFWN
jgi:uncharacterized protein YjiS (DUF1127 family)